MDSFSLGRNCYTRHAYSVKTTGLKGFVLQPDTAVATYIIIQSHQVSTATTS